MIVFASLMAILSSIALASATSSFVWRCSLSIIFLHALPSSFSFPALILQIFIAPSLIFCLMDSHFVVALWWVLLISASIIVWILSQ